MNFFRTALLLAALTALFMAVGFLLGGATGMLIAFVIAAGMNLFTYWNSDRMVLSQQDAEEVDESQRAGALRDCARSLPRMLGCRCRAFTSFTPISRMPSRQAEILTMPPLLPRLAFCKD